jgi:hypothetical protein
MVQQDSLRWHRRLRRYRGRRASSANLIVVPTPGIEPGGELVGGHVARPGIKLGFTPCLNAC